MRTHADTVCASERRCVLLLVLWMYRRLRFGAQVVWGHNTIDFDRRLQWHVVSLLTCVFLNANIHQSRSFPVAVVAAVVLLLSLRLRGTCWHRRLLVSQSNRRVREVSGRRITA